MILSTADCSEPLRVPLSCRRALGGVLLSAFVPFQVTVRVNAPLPGASSRVMDFDVGTAGNVLYVADQEREGVFELFQVPVDGSSPPVRLHTPLPANGDVLVQGEAGLGGNVLGFLRASGRVVYRADARIDGVYELFSVSRSGDQPEVRLSPSLGPGGGVGVFQITEDGQQVVFLADKHVDGAFELFVVPIDGSAPARRMHGPFSRFVRSFEPVPPRPQRKVDRFWLVGERAVYTVTESAGYDAGTFSIYSVPLDGSVPPTLLSRSDFPAFSFMSVSTLRFSPDHEWIAYLDSFWNPPVESYGFLYLQRTDGSAARITLDARGGGGSLGLKGFTADSQRLVWSWSSGADGMHPNHHLYTSDLDGQKTPIDLSLSEPVRAVALGPGANDVYSVSQNSGVFRHQADGMAAPVYLGPSTTSGLMEVSPDASCLVMGGDGLHSLPIGGGTLTDLQSPGFASIYTFRILPDSSGVVYAYRLRQNRYELRYAPLDGSAAPLTLHPALPAGGTVAVSPNVDQPRFRLVGSHVVVFLASLASASSTELWVTLF